VTTPYGYRPVSPYSTPGAPARYVPEPATGTRRVIVTGSRDWADAAVVRTALTRAWRDGGQPLVVVHGACPTGADAIADAWAVEHEHCGITVERWPANWRTFGRAAGPARNTAMVAKGADLVLAFPLGRSAGTRGCIAAARRAGLHVIVHESDLQESA
jgi:hypothetical protein